MTKQYQIKELTDVIRKDYPEVNAEHIAILAVEWFNGKSYYIVSKEMTHIEKAVVITEDEDMLMLQLVNKSLTDWIKDFKVKRK